MVSPGRSSRYVGEYKTTLGGLSFNSNNLHVSHLQWLNSANIVLLPKKEVADEISEYRHIDLIHAIAKIITKILSIRLAPSWMTLCPMHKVLHQEEKYSRQLLVCTQPCS
jgi:hypothetical protein